MKQIKLDILFKKILNYMSKAFTGKVDIQINFLEGNVTKIYFLPRIEIK